MEGYEGSMYEDSSLTQEVRKNVAYSGHDFLSVRLTLLIPTGLLDGHQFLFHREDASLAANSLVQ